MTDIDHMIDTIGRHAKSYMDHTISASIPTAMRQVDRLAYGGSYDDQAYPIGHGQTISQPFMVAIMTHLLALQAQDHVLEIGTGSGYQAAILAKLAARVDTIERVRALHTSAFGRLQSLPNVHAHLDDGQLGYASAAPFDKIIVTCMVPELAPAWISQLKLGGRIVAPIQTESMGLNDPGTSIITVWQKDLHGMQNITEQCLPKAPLYCQFVPLIPGQA
jgi:protein-L-isoaspartate(D-aspartate) O-methyltransferase